MSHIATALMGRKKTNFRETEFDEVAAYQQLLDFEEEWVRKPERNTLSEQPCPNNPVLPIGVPNLGCEIWDFLHVKSPNFHVQNLGPLLGSLIIPPTL